jgi:Fic family protein
MHTRVRGIDIITLLLCERQVLSQPLLYLSHCLKAYRAQYYDRLTAVRHDGDWEGWLKFFLRGVFQVSQAATNAARELLAMREEHCRLIVDNVNALRLHDYLFERPVISIRAAEAHLGCASATGGFGLGRAHHHMMAESMKTSWSGGRPMWGQPELTPGP